MATAVELVARNVLDDLLGQADADDAAAHGQHVGVVVRAGQAGGVQVVAQRGAHTADLVGGDLLALPAAAEHDADFGVAVAHGSADARRRSRIVDRFGESRAVIERPRDPRPQQHRSRCCFSS